MGLLMGILGSRLTGPIAGVIAVLAILFGISQCSGKVSAEHKLAKADKELVAVRQDYKTCQANERTLGDLIDLQNKAVDAAKANSDRRQAEIAKARQAAASEAARASRAEKALSTFKPVGNDQCSRLLSVDERVKELSK